MVSPIVQRWKLRPRRVKLLSITNKKNRCGWFLQRTACSSWFVTQPIRTLSDATFKWGNWATQLNMTQLILSGTIQHLLTLRLLGFLFYLRHADHLQLYISRNPWYKKSLNESKEQMKLGAFIFMQIVSEWRSRHKDSMTLIVKELEIPLVTITI